MICELSLPPKQKNAIYLIFLLCVQIGCTCGDYLCSEVKTQLRMCQRIGNMLKARALKKSSFLKTKTKNAYDL